MVNPSLAFSGVQINMEPRFKDCDRDTLFLMPPSVNDWVPENHLSRFVVDIVNRLDLSPISDAYPPSMMVALLFYAYATYSPVLFRVHRIKDSQAANPRNGPTKADQLLSVQFIGPSEVVNNFGNWFPSIGMPLVVGQLVVFDDGAVLILSFGRS